MTIEREVTIAGQTYPVILSDENEALQAAKAAGRAIVGLWRENEEKQPETDTSAKVNLSKETPVETETAEVSKDQEAPEAPTEIPSTETKSETSEGGSTEA